MGVVTDATTSAGFTTVISPFYNQSSSANTLMKTTSCSPPATPPKQQQQQQQQQVLTQSTAVVASPCAACKILRRRCAENCVLAPYFPPTEPLKFTTAHRVFGASNIIKFLQELPESQRADAVSSMVYEANARIRDPVYGCAGAICQLQKQVNDLQAQLAKSRAQILNLQFQLQAQLMTRFITHQSLSSPTDGGGNGGGGGRFPLTTTSLSPSSSSTLSPPEEEPVRIIDGYFPTSGNVVNIDDDVPGSYCAYLDVEGMQSFGWEAADMILG